MTLAPIPALQFASSMIWTTFSHSEIHSKFFYRGIYFNVIIHTWASVIVINDPINLDYEEKRHEARLDTEKWKGSAGGGIREGDRGWTESKYITCMEKCYAEMHCFIQIIYTNSKNKISFQTAPLSGCALLITLVILSRSSFLIYRETSQPSLDPECEDKMIYELNVPNLVLVQGKRHSEKWVVTIHLLC